MTISIKKGESLVSINRKLKRFSINKKGAKGFPANKFLGKIKSERSPLEIQKELRNEWQSRIS